MRFVFLVFVIVPIIEIFLLIQVGHVIGAFSTIAIVILTAAIGVRLLRQQGYQALQRAREKMSVGAVPAEEMVEGLFLAVGGALLLTPGFVTDALGFCCLVPSLRRLLMRWGQRYLNLLVVRGPVSWRSASRSSSERTIEGEYKREDE